ncbi:P2Y purinoceptor 8-like [Scleropages formosus]|uniref:P2Y purinoceptor 8-like n=1 Tax=Scleropages formosus TaxID=113540 RepID=A0A8C9R937_SCLFO|nr:P2Y purinoceptor 8-like [Scleropages formosus]
MHHFKNNTSSNLSQSISNGTIEMLGSPLLTLGMPIIYLLVFIISTPCNLVSLWILSCYTTHRNPTVVFAINLSFTDLLYSAFLPLQVVYHLRGNDWPFGQVMCSVSTLVFYCNMNGSILTTCAVSLERYCGIVRPLHTKHWRTGRNAVLICLFIWALVLLVHIPVFHKDITFPVLQLNVTTCFDIFPRHLFSSKLTAYLYFVTVLLFFFILPLLVLTGCYISIIRSLCHSPHDVTKDSKKQTILLILLVMLCFVFCYLPNILIQIMHMIYNAKGKTLYAYYKLSLGINSLSCCIDPFIYYFASREFRQKLQWKLCCVSEEHEEPLNSNFSEQRSPSVRHPDQTSTLL